MAVCLHGGKGVGMGHGDGSRGGIGGGTGWKVWGVREVRNARAA